MFFELRDGEEHDRYTLIFQFTIYFCNQGSSCLIYWQLGGWFQRHKELEDEGVLYKCIKYLEAIFIDVANW